MADKMEKDFDDSMDDDDLTVTQLRKRIKQMRQLLSEKTEEQKDKEAKEADKDREDLASLHDEGKTKSAPYDDSEETAAFTDDESDDAEKKEDKEEDKKSDKKDD